MNLGNIVKLSLVGLRANKMRSLLTMLGIVIGIAAVIIIMSVGAGAQSLILDQVQKVGSNLVGILPGAPNEEGPPAAAMGIVVKTLTIEDSDTLQRRLPEITAITPYVRGIDTITWQNQRKDSYFIGVNSEYPQVEKSDLVSGRFFDLEEGKTISRVSVLGYKIAKELFGETDPVGQDIKIKKENFKVIGVFKERGNVALQDPDNQVFIPVLAAQKLLLGINHVSMIRAKIDESQNISATIEQIKQILRDRHNITDPAQDDFDVRDQAEALEILTTITNALKFFLAAIAAISLVVGGIGIMNIMFVAVTERTREIGLRKAVGANNKQVLNQFLVESIIVTFLGGVIGIITGALFSGAVAMVASYMGYNWQYIITIPSVIAGLAVASSIGLIFGYFPARRAAKLSPIEALRYE